MDDTREVCTKRSFNRQTDAKAGTDQAFDAFPANIMSHHFWPVYWRGKSGDNHVMNLMSGITLAQQKRFALEVGGNERSHWRPADGHRAVQQEGARSKPTLTWYAEAAFWPERQRPRKPGSSSRIGAICRSNLAGNGDVAPRTSARRDAGWISRELKMSRTNRLLREPAG